MLGLGTGTLGQATLGPSCPPGVGDQHRGVNQLCLWGIVPWDPQHCWVQTEQGGMGTKAGENPGSAAGGCSLYGEAFPCF